MNQESNSDTQLKPKSIVAMEFHWKLDGPVTLAVRFADNTEKYRVATTESDKEDLLEIAKTIESQIDRWNLLLRDKSL